MKKVILLVMAVCMCCGAAAQEDGAGQQGGQNVRRERFGNNNGQNQQNNQGFPGFPGGGMGFPGGGMGFPGGPFGMFGNMKAINYFGVDFDRTPLKEKDVIVTDRNDSTYLYYVENVTFGKKVRIHYEGDKVLVSGDTEGLKTANDGAELSITAPKANIEYELSGKSTAGSLHIKSDHPTKIVLNGVDLTSQAGEAIKVTGKSAVYMVVGKGTENRLEDQYREVAERQIGPFPMMGQRKDTPVETEVVNGLTMKKAENRSEDKAKSKVDGVISSAGLLAISGEGVLTLKGHNKNGLKSKGHMVVRPGNVIHIEVTQGKGMNANGDIRLLGGVLNVDASDAGKDGIRSEESIYISGGRTTVKSSGTDTSEGIEAKYNIVIDEGLVEVASYDDAINSGGNLIINGGRVYAAAVMNDALDANSNLVISGGTVVALGGGMPECGIDAAEEEGYEVFITGGTVVATGGMATRTSKQSTQGSVICSVEKIDSATVYSLEDEEKALLLFKSPRSYNSGTLFFSSPSLRAGESYTVCKNNKSEMKNAFHGMWADGKNNGEEIEIVDMLTMPYSQVGRAGMMMGGPMGGFFGNFGRNNKSDEEE